MRASASIPVVIATKSRRFCEEVSVEGSSALQYNQVNPTWHPCQHPFPTIQIFASVGPVVESGYSRLSFVSNANGAAHEQPTANTHNRCELM